jgi:NADP-dependent aldehyde dehydrogenase
MVTSIDPRTGEARSAIAEGSATDELEARCRAAAAVAPVLDGLGRHGRARLLREMGAALEAERAALVALADEETALGPARLGGELTRTVFQLQFFAEVLEDGAYLEATIDHAGETAMGPRPDLRRMLVPLGPVAVFGASNFPFAFSVPGGDTASAVAAGCPVIVKAHDAHLETSLASAAALRRGAERAGICEDVIGVVVGEEAGAALVQHPLVRAVGFTGSLGGGRALRRLAEERPSPIPFYGELGALNAMVVLPGAAERRGREIAAGLASSFTLGVGQFCTKPGLVLVPVGAPGDELVRALGEHVAALGAGTMLSERIAAGFHAGTEALRAAAGVRVLAEATGATGGGFSGRPLLVAAPAGALSGVLLEECFGPVLIVARYGDGEECARLVGDLAPALTASVHADDDDEALAAPLLALLRERAGRLVWNGYPTGVAVSWAMHHGGPYPATTDPLHTSVGAAAIRRFLRPVCYQNVPAALLPPELLDAPVPAAAVPRRVDGLLVRADGRAGE